MIGMPHADQKYIDALVINDSLVLKELYQKFSGKIKGMVLKNNGSETDAADIFQEALLYIYHKAKDENFTLTCPLDAFLYLVCKNKWLNILKKRQHAGVTIVDEEGFHYLSDDGYQLADECRLQQERRDLLQEKLAQLGEGCRELLQLSWSGKSMEEVAGILKVSYGYARKKKCECMARLVSLVKQSSQFNSLKR
jgi:RNA polymerase sigma factor (sigma-70 family)